jgi:hypothetical protein
MASGAQATNVPTGYRFSPNDDDLIVHYLKKKILGQQLPADVIPTTDVYASSPDKLPLGLSLSYFFVHMNIFFFSLTFLSLHHMFPLLINATSALWQPNLRNRNQIISRRRRDHNDSSEVI